MKKEWKELKKNLVRYKKNYDKKTKLRLFNEGDKVLVMLPIDNNKIFMQLKRPYQITQKIGNHSYKILVGNKEKNYHVNRKVK